MEMNNQKLDNDSFLVKTSYEQLVKEIAKVIVGQEELVKYLYVCLLAAGHALIEGVPGLGKTLLVKSLGAILDLKYSRIQFTPDLMPSDILGTNIVTEDEKGKRHFEFYQGPLFGQIILADEINRASPKTQSALLEAMQEQQVTIFGKDYALALPFFVLATQNPLEMEGTYPLPEAQIDRFFFKLTTVYPDLNELSEIIEKTTHRYVPELNHILDSNKILKMQEVIKEVPVAEHVKEYAIRLVLATHPNKENNHEQVKQFVHYGASPRGAQSLILAGKVWALLDDRFNVAKEDIRAVAKPALRHRIILNMRGETEGINPDDIIDNLLSTL